MSVRFGLWRVCGGAPADHASKTKPLGCSCLDRITVVYTRHNVKSALQVASRCVDLFGSAIYQCEAPILSDIDLCSPKSNASLHNNPQRPDPRPLPGTLLFEKSNSERNETRSVTRYERHITSLIDSLLPVVVHNCSLIQTTQNFMVSWKRKRPNFPS